MIIFGYTSSNITFLMKLTLEVNFADIENCTDGHSQERNEEEDLINCFNSINIDRNFVELDTSAKYTILDIKQDLFGEVYLYIGNRDNLVLKFKIISDSIPILNSLQQIRFLEYSRVYRDTYHVSVQI